MAHVVAVPANPAIENALQDFLQSAEHGRDNTSAKMISLVDHMTDRLLSLLLVEPAKLSRLSASQGRVIDFAVSTGGKASHMLTRQVYKKTTADEFRLIADNMAKMYWPAGEDNDQKSFLCCKTSDRLAGDFARAEALCANGQGTSDITLVVSAMDSVTDEIIDSFFVENTKLIKVGFVTQKALNVGVEGSRKAVHAVTHKVLKGLDDKSLKVFMSHYANIIRQR